MKPYDDKAGSPAYLASLRAYRATLEGFLDGIAIGKQPGNAAVEMQARTSLSRVNAGICRCMDAQCPLSPGDPVVLVYSGVRGRVAKARANRPDCVAVASGAATYYVSRSSVAPDRG